MYSTDSKIYASFINNFSGVIIRTAAAIYFVIKLNYGVYGIILAKTIDYSVRLVYCVLFVEIFGTSNFNGVKL